VACICALENVLTKTESAITKVTAAAGGGEKTFSLVEDFNIRL